MEKLKFPAWATISRSAKIWTVCILLSPFGFSILLKALPHSIQKLVVNIAVLFPIYLLFRRVFNRRGPSWFSLLDFLVRKIVALFSKNQGELWLKWAKNARNDQIHRDMIERSANCGNPDGLYEWGLICKSEMRKDSAVAAFLKAAQAGHIKAAYEVAKSARYSPWMPNHRAVSRKWYEFAAHNGHEPSIRVLATALETGAGLDVDIEAAKRWQKQLHKVISHHGSHKKHKLEMITEEWGNRQGGSFFEALRFIYQIANALVSRVPLEFVQKSTPIILWGTLLALIMFVLFLILSGGLFALAAVPSIVGVAWMYKHSYRPDRALIELEKRADASEPNAMFELGMLYRNGSPHLPPHIRTAREWLLKASIAGHIEAMVQLSQLMAWGYGGPKDIIQARHWLHKAKSLGHHKAGAYLKIMSN